MAAPTGLGFAERNNRGRSMSWVMFGYYNSTSLTGKLKLVSFIPPGKSIPGNCLGYKLLSLSPRVGRNDAGSLLPGHQHSY
jgi:hypothetical protein